LHQTAAKYGQRPSHLLDLSGEPYLAYCLDQAVSWYGHWIEARLDEKKDVKNSKGQVIGHKPKYRLGQLLGTEKPELATAEQLIAAFS
jgi:hypothetical protein